MSRIETIGNATLYLGDCLDVLKTLPTNSVDSVVCDPPYGLSFMGKKWDYDVPSVEIWAECLRVLKPGGHLLAFAGTRTQHRMAVRIEDAGFEIRDMIAWVYGSGFPKSHNVGKSIDREAGAQREVVGKAAAGSAPLKRGHVNTSGGGLSVGTERSPEYDITAPATEAARQWQGWGTALKPALEPITVARKPLVGTVAANVLEHGAGALNIDGCRVGEEVVEKGRAGRSECKSNSFGKTLRSSEYQQWQAGRWPANLIHDGSDEVLAGFPETGPSPKQYTKKKAGWLPPGSEHVENDLQTREYGDTGSAARFFYCAKASRADRNEGCEGMEQRGAFDGAEGQMGGNMGSRSKPGENHHPTVKPTDLMAYLCRLVTPPGSYVAASPTVSGALWLNGYQISR
jgi:site-specific DNA-methyltransferase (adenine-specific)